MTRAIGAPGALAALAVLACAPSPADERDPSTWNLAVVVLDALPAGAVGAWGYPRDTTPNLDAFAAEGVRFEHAYAGASYTLASVSSMFTGLGPAAHGVVSLSSNVLDPKHETLAEAFRSRGFRTGGFSCNPHITEEGGFAQGFEEFRHYGRGRLDAHSIPRAIEGDSLAWWSAHEGERRFLYVHVLPPHQPYDPPAPHAELFGAGDTERELGFTDWLVEADREGTVTAGSPLAKAIRARYDAGVHYADAFLGRFLGKLRATPGGPDTAICVVSDHGEAFAEHGRLLHGSTVFEEMTHVPLVLWWPGVEPTVVRDVVSTVYLAPTLCELFDLPFARGESFLPAVFEPYESPPVLSRSVGNAPVWALRTNEWTFVKQPTTDQRLLYHRRTDLAEANELLGSGAPFEPRGMPEPLSVADLRALSNELSQRLGATLSEDRRRGKGFTRARDDTHSEAIGDLGYAED